ncbi:MAG TPA: hypothetical protein VK936_07140 [Longimicrobiales bacterium]|nr:hypothetical protein [Longimicrobiales bacterium]
MIEIACDRRLAVARGGCCESGRGRVFVRQGGVLTTVRDDGLAESQARLTELGQLLAAQFRVPFLHVPERLLHPLDLVVAVGAEHATLPDGAEELVAGTVE